MAELFPPGPLLSAFVLASVVLAVTPGPGVIYIVARCLAQGRRSGLASVAGVALGNLGNAAAASLGLAALFAVSSLAFTVVKWAGAAYLVWLGIGMLRQAWRGPAAANTPGAAAQRRPWLADFRSGLLTNVLNPKVALFFLAFLPQFVPAASPSQTASFLLLGGWFIVQGTVFLLVLVVLAAQLQRLGSNGPLARVLNALGGLLFIGLALRILRERPAGA
jgi:threonine/homoserine/homoserine lactone efflux protein